ncbi:unnamed protein product [Calypogeia fissa]
MAKDEDQRDDRKLVSVMVRWITDIHLGRYDFKMLRHPQIFKYYCGVRTIVEVSKRHELGNRLVIKKDGIMPDGGTLLYEIFKSYGPSAIRMYNIIIGSQIIRGERPALRQGTPQGVKIAYLMIHEERTITVPMEQAPPPTIETYRPSEVWA